MWPKLGCLAKTLLLATPFSASAAEFMSPRAATAAGSRSTGSTDVKVTNMSGDLLAQVPHEEGLTIGDVQRAAENARRGIRGLLRAGTSALLPHTERAASGETLQAVLSNYIRVNDEATGRLLAEVEHEEGFTMRDVEREVEHAHRAGTELPFLVRKLRRRGDPAGAALPRANLARPGDTLEAEVLPRVSVVMVVNPMNDAILVSVGANEGRRNPTTISVAELQERWVQQHPAEGKDGQLVVWRQDDLTRTPLPGRQLLDIPATQAGRAPPLFGRVEETPLPHPETLAKRHRDFYREAESSLGTWVGNAQRDYLRGDMIPRTVAGNAEEQDPEELLRAALREAKENSERYYLTPALEMLDQVRQLQEVLEGASAEEAAPLAPEAQEVLDRVIPADFNSSWRGDARARARAYLDKKLKPEIREKVRQFKARAENVTTRLQDKVKRFGKAWAGGAPVPTEEEGGSAVDLWRQERADDAGYIYADPAWFLTGDMAQPPPMPLPPVTLEEMRARAEAGEMTPELFRDFIRQGWTPTDLGDMADYLRTQ